MKAIPMPVVDVPLQYLIVVFPLKAVPPTVDILGEMLYLMEIVQPRPVPQSLIILLPQSPALAPQQPTVREAWLFHGRQLLIMVVMEM